MLSQLKEFFKLKNLLNTILIPILAFISLGLIQRYIYDWSALQNTGFKRAIEISGYLFVLILLYLFVLPWMWLRPYMNIKLYKRDSSQARPETSVVFDQADRTISVDVILEIEFSPSWSTRFLATKWTKSKQKLGIELRWNPPYILSCECSRKGDLNYCVIQPNGIDILPFDKLNMRDDNFIQYLFRFALGGNDVAQRLSLLPRHLNWRSRLLFGVNPRQEFLFDIRDSRPRDTFPTQTEQVEISKS